MTLIKRALRNRPIQLLTLLALVAGAFAVPQAPALAACPDASTVFFYSDASMTTKVGECRHACCQLWTCTGEVTMFGREVRRFSCSVQ